MHTSCPPGPRFQHRTPITGKPILDPSTIQLKSDLLVDLAGTPFLCAERIIHAAANVSSPLRRSLFCFRVLSLEDNRRIERPPRHRTRRRRASLNRRVSLRAGRSFTGRTGRGGVLWSTAPVGGGAHR